MTDAKTPLTDLLDSALAYAAHALVFVGLQFAGRDKE